MTLVNLYARGIHFRQLFIGFVQPISEYITHGGEHGIGISFQGLACRTGTTSATSDESDSQGITASGKGWRRTQIESQAASYNCACILNELPSVWLRG